MAGAPRAGKYQPNSGCAPNTRQEESGEAYPASAHDMQVVGGDGDDAVKLIIQLQSVEANVETVVPG